MNWIQKYALSVLMRSPEASLKQMRPKSVDSNLFSYHIHYLKVNHIIESVSRGTYRLTPKGMRVVGKFSSQTGIEANDVKSVIMLYAKHESQVLVFKWSRHPYFGSYTLPHDRYDFGRTISEALEEAMRDKLNLTVEQAHPVYHKSGIVTIFHGDEQISCMSAHVYDVSSDVVVPQMTRNGSLEWMERDEMAQDSHVARGLTDLVKQLDDENIAIFEATLRY